METQRQHLADPLLAQQLFIGVEDEELRYVTRDLLLLQPIKVTRIVL